MCVKTNEVWTLALFTHLCGNEANFSQVLKLDELKKKDSPNNCFITMLIFPDLIETSHDKTTQFYAIKRVWKKINEYIADSSGKIRLKILLEKTRSSRLVFVYLFFSHKIIEVWRFFKKVDWNSANWWLKNVL